VVLKSFKMIVSMRSAAFLKIRLNPIGTASLKIHLINAASSSRRGIKKPLDRIAMPSEIRITEENRSAVNMPINPKSKVTTARTPRI
jgi:hypothetical protein